MEKNHQTQKTCRVFRQNSQAERIGRSDDSEVKEERIDYANFKQGVYCYVFIPYFMYVFF